MFSIDFVDKGLMLEVGKAVVVRVTVTVVVLVVPRT